MLKSRLAELAAEMDQDLLYPKLQSKIIMIQMKFNKGKATAKFLNTYKSLQRKKRTQKLRERSTQKRLKLHQALEKWSKQRDKIWLNNYNKLRQQSNPKSGNCHLL